MNLIKNVVLASVLGSGMCMAQNVQSVTPAIPVDKNIEANIQKWLNKMTLEEKIGQMCEITIDVVTDFEASKKHGFTMSEAMLDTVIGKYKVGSLLNVPLSVAQKKEVWAKAIKRIQEISMKEIGIPCIYGVDQIHGTTYTLDGTMFPQGINICPVGHYHAIPVQSFFQPLCQQLMIGMERYSVIDSRIHHDTQGSMTNRLQERSKMFLTHIATRNRRRCTILS